MSICVSLSYIWIIYLTIDDALLIENSEEIGRSKYNSMIGLAHHERVDEALYDDFETAKAREVSAWILDSLIYSSSFMNRTWSVPH